MKDKMEIKELEKISKELLQSSGSHMTQIMVNTDQGMVVMALAFTNEKEKEEMRKSVKLFVNTSNCESYFFITEGWIKKFDKNKPISNSAPWIRPSESADRTEGLIIIEFRKDMKQAMVINQFSRDKNNKIIFGERVEDNSNKNGFSIWNFYLEDDGMMERRDKLMESETDSYIKALSKKYSKEYYQKFINSKTKEEQMQVLSEMMNKMKEETEKGEINGN